MTRTLRTITLLAAFTLVLAACGDDGETAGEFDLVTEGTLTVCTDVPYAPMEFEDASAPGGYTGFDIELMRAIAVDLGLDLAVVTPGWENITSGAAMAAGNCDVAAASITILPERAENVTFSDPYFSGDQSLLVKADSGISSAADLAGLAVAVQTNTTGSFWAEDNLTDVEIIYFEDAAGPYLALDSGQVAGVITDIVANQAVADEDETVMIAETFTTDEEYGFAFQKEGVEDLVAAVNATLSKFRDDGTYDSIFSDWFPAA